MTIAVDGYLHYYIGDYFGNDESIIDRYAKVKNNILKTHRMNFKKDIGKKIKNITHNTRQERKMMDIIWNGKLFDSKLYEYVNESLSSGHFGTSGSKAIGDVSFASFGSLTPAAREKLIDQKGNLIVTNLSVVISTMKKVLEKMQENLSVLSGNNFDFMDAVKTKANNFSNNVALLPSEIFGKSQNYLVDIDVDGVSKAAQKIAKSYLTMSSELALLESIAVNGTAIVNDKTWTECFELFKRHYKEKYKEEYKGNTLNAAEMVSKIIGKFGGSMNDANGTLYEIAILNMFNDADMKVGKQLYNIQSSWTGPNYVDVTLDPRLKQLYSYEIPSKAKSKNDVTLTISGPNVFMKADFGVNVKRSNSVKKNSNSHFGGVIKLEDSKNLLTLLKIAAVKYPKIYAMMDMYHIAGSQSKIVKGKQRLTWNGDSMYSTWLEVVRSVAMLNLLDAISGISKKQSSAFLVINDEFYGIGSILDAIISNPRAVEIDGGQQRAKFYSLNTWMQRGTTFSQSAKIKRPSASVNKKTYKGSFVKMSSAAYNRSTKAKTAINNAFSSTLITTKLHMSMLNL